MDTLKGLLRKYSRLTQHSCTSEMSRGELFDICGWINLHLSKKSLAEFLRLIKEKSKYSGEEYVFLTYSKPITIEELIEMIDLVTKGELENEVR